MANKIQLLERTVQWKNNDVVQGNQRLREEARSYIDSKKTKI